MSLNVTGAAYFVVLPANASLPAVVDSQVLTTQNASAVLGGAAIAASGNVIIPRAFTNQSQVVLVCGTLQQSVIVLCTLCLCTEYASCSVASCFCCTLVSYLLLVTVDNNMIWHKNKQRTLSSF